MRLFQAIVFICSLSLFALAGCGAPKSAVAEGAQVAAAAADAGESIASDTQNDTAWDTVFFDDFDGPELDRAKWKPEVSCWGGGNNERQCYTDRPENIQLKEGVLRLVGQKEEYTGPKFPEGMQGAPGGEQTKPYTSGKIRTRGLAAFKYGRVSARLRVPEGQGAWPAFWMMSADDVYGPWPLSGEIDIMEAINQETPCAECPGGVERRTSGALHFGGPVPDNTYLFMKTSGEREIGPSKEFRVYAIEWARDSIQWLMDGEVYMRVEHDDWYSDAPEAEGNAHAPFDQPFYMMLNLAVGGNLAEKFNGGGFDPSTFPAALEIDWVRVEQCREDPETGTPCLTDQAWDGEPEGPWEVQAR